MIGVLRPNNSQFRLHIFYFDSPVFMTTLASFLGLDDVDVDVGDPLDPMEEEDEEEEDEEVEDFVTNFFHREEYVSSR